MSPRMFIWLRRFLHEQSSLQPADVAALWLGIMLGFFCVLRASEYLARSNRSRS